MVWKITFYHIMCPPLIVTIFIMHVRKLRQWIPIGTM